MNKKIYLEPTWKLHSLYNSLIRYPPKGYEFIVPQTLDNKIFKAASKINFSYFLQLRVLDKVMPLNLIKPCLERFKKISPETVLTYSCGHLVLRKEPWIIDLECVSLLAGFNIKHFNKYKRFIENTLASNYCKKIICWSEAGKRTVLLNLDCSKFEQKLEVVPFAVQKRNFTKSWDDKKVKLLFVNSGNIPMQFHYKGGKEVLQAFIILRSRYNNLELVVRSDMPKDLKDKYKGVGNLRIIDKVISWESLEQEFMSADIFLYPTHSSQDIVVLDAMSYGLPVIITDVFANSEMVEDGKTGFVIKKSKRALGSLVSGSCTSSQFEKAVRTANPEVIQEVVEKASTLIENPELRRRMGNAGRWEVEHGKFSIEKRNEKLKRIFDEATADSISGKSQN